MEIKMKKKEGQNMKEPTLVIMAAGMGSRYGGLKQMDPMDSQGHIIMDFSIYDAIRAGFQKVVFIIKKENEGIFRERIGSRIEKIMNVTYGTVRLSSARTRWGSCSARGNLNFHWKLILMPPEVLDYVVVHELAHRREMNHSPRFWAIVEKVLPDYKERRRWLKENGATV